MLFKVIAKLGNTLEDFNGDPWREGIMGRQVDEGIGGRSNTSSNVIAVDGDKEGNQKVDCKWCEHEQTKRSRIDHTLTG